jgi:hypothetical protein
MFELDAFVIRGHEKVIGHYLRLRNSARSEMERQRLQSRIDQEREAMQRYLKEQSRYSQRDAAADRRAAQAA